MGDNRESFPLTSYLVGGTQSETGHFNYVVLMKMHNLHKTLKEEKSKNDKDDDSDDEDGDDDNSDDDEDEDKLPHLSQAVIQHVGCVNRIKVKFVTLQDISWGFFFTLEIFFFS